MRHAPHPSMNPIDRKKFLFNTMAILLAGPQVLKGAASTRLHKVKKGDTLSEIARDYAISVRELKSYNGLKSDLIRIGQNLKIPPKLRYLEHVQAHTNRLKLNRKKWKYIVAHHSAIAWGNAAIYDKADRNHGMENGLAYHFVIGNGRDSGDGEIEYGSRWTKQLHGGHVSSWEHNNHGIGICLVGNFEKTRPTPRQLASFTRLVDYLGNGLLRGSYQFKVHKEINATLCPGRHFPTTAMHKQFG